MEAQKIFKRYEYKYMLTLEQQSELKEVMKQYMIADAFGRSTICNLYFDTPQYLLIRRSIENHVYKEKIRLRTYGQATPETNAFIESKKKYKKVVYKRRISASYEDAMQYLCQRADVIPHSQICSELDYALSLYQEIQPAMYLSYEREAFYGKDDHELRITFDQHILWRTEDLNLSSPVYGRELLQPGQVLTEIKIGHAMPLWLNHFLTEHHIYRTSFSKYGTAYKTLLMEAGQNRRISMHC
ncbi:polyphosphate polymerase domain-containing protein [uncultured Eubacterium sp.]|uniref:polyphosphate polymerase domain-containing protein n=1 Tax=uncultured Eubacterium sp. TaxID=165185 RepID=UPI0025F1D1AD|nr:polyphosphate polymerase domain-containing protein [uncultured Eubacterium sp.]